MDGFQHMSAEADSRQHDCSSASAASHGSGTDRAFLARAEQWRKAALCHPDDRQACIGATNAGTAKTLHVHEKALERSIENCPTSLLEEPSIQRAIAAHTGLLRQWNSLMSFEARLEQMRLEAEKQEVERQSAPLLRTAR